ncbi:FAD-dependent oxidoreductase [Nocardia sp. NPDC088792]|uniref:FAD-dependent oxidoreductase n=1 Tax=Nocardia sp. NPDC088792 TaxID=3364332 RepID=UPI00380BFDEB
MATTILGGGIAGTALAGALARTGESVSLYERQHHGGGGGAFLFLDARGHVALTGLGVDLDALHAASHPIRGLDVTDSSGPVSARMDTGHRLWLRRNLIGVLREFLDGSDVDTHYDTAVSGVSVDAGACVLRIDGRLPVTVADGPVIAADGIDSVVRGAIEPDRTPVYAGDVVIYGIATQPLTLPTPAAILHFYNEIIPSGKGSTFGHVWDHGIDTVWFLRIPREPLRADDLGLRTAGDWADEVLAATPSNRAVLETLLAHTDSVHVSNARTVPLDTAADPKAPALLVGDADHAITPAAGVGARDALEDVHAVYRAITRGESVAAAVAARRAQIRAERAAARQRIQASGR